MDVGVLNFQNAFDSVNFEKAYSSKFISKAASFGYNDPAYFLMRILDRIIDRLLHISFVQNMDNPLLFLSDMDPVSTTASLGGIQTYLFDSLEESNQAGKPLFAHIHLLSTHGQKFYSEDPVFSKNQEQTSDWMVDFYDDAILDYDQWLKELVIFLEDKGYYDNTLIVFYTDHAEEWSVQRRVPLMIHFPNDEIQGEIIENTQNLDVAPTILDYMGLEIPDWMAGQSLLSELNRSRLIYSVQITAEEIDQSSFNQIDYLDVIQCQYLYEINMDDGTMIRKTVPAYVGSCEETLLDEPDQIWDSSITLLTEYGFKIPSGWDDPVVYKIE